MRCFTAHLRWYSKKHLNIPLCSCSLGLVSPAGCVCERSCIQSRKLAQPEAKHTSPLPSPQECLEPELYLADEVKGPVQFSHEVLALHPSALLLQFTPGNDTAELLKCVI